jgi:hypothetical protein
VNALIVSMKWLLGQSAVVSDGNPLWAWLILGALGLLMAWALWKRFSKRPPGASQAATPLAETQPQALPTPSVSLPPSELEVQRKAEAEALRRQAEERLNRLAQLDADKAQAETGERAALEAQQKALKDEAEAAKKEAYRAAKAAEVEEKERRKK